MKLNKSKWLMSIIAGCILCFTSCEKDENFKENIKDDSSTYRLNYDDFLTELNQFKITSDQLAKNLFFAENKYKNKIGNNNPITISVNKEKVTKIIGSENLVTYVFNVTTDDVDPREHYYKLVLINQNKKYDIKLLKFLPNITNLQIPIQSKLKGSVISIPLKENPLFSRVCEEMVYPQDIFVPCVNHGQYEAGNGCWGGH